MQLWWFILLVLVQGELWNISGACAGVIPDNRLCAVQKLSAQFYWKAVVEYR